MFATRLFRWSYQHILKPIAFRLDPEDVHDAMIRVASYAQRSTSMKKMFYRCFEFSHPTLEQTIHGIHFTNPIGLSAGFDKNAEIINAIASTGFGFTEVGSITGEPCAGNPKPRLWRLPKSQAIMVWYGLKNDGCVAIAHRLRGQQFPIPVGTSVARTNDKTTVELGAGIADYAKAFRELADIGSYTTINISCPNTCGGEPFTSPERLELLLNSIDTIPTLKPIFLKLPADLTFSDADALIAVARNHRVHGFIVSNLTKQRQSPDIDHSELSEAMRGGISGKPTFDRSNALIAHIFQAAGDRFTIIGVGGVFSAADAYEKIRCGASLVQLITGLIFEGPQLVGEINRGLVMLLKNDGFANIHEAVGSRLNKRSFR
ncbi:MAG: quinone-dependent dihydroorotate dehydrogenase [Patescibacteria group bacterium]